MEAVRYGLRYFMGAVMLLFGLVIACYGLLVLSLTALLSVLLLDLSLTLATLCPHKAVFRPKDLVYLENYKFARLFMQASGWGLGGR